ncbi:glycosyltransferase [Paracoccus subflavus]|uniref:Glycosyltransferase n=1 Tax=Paracoccus subflavus TaxID=2528244 RepID=A0A4Q9G5P9_9RHOB|nr:glycosyltransferase family 2 protein [Paracoccus subflavus]TBN43963.1 glycosyltransferase [Paracoccus subflavus]
MSFSDSSLTPPPDADATASLSWALCVATLDRIDMLEHCVTCAMAQTRAPHQIVIVDASSDWQANRERIRVLVGDRVPLVYLPAPERSLTVQRNTAIAACNADICMLIDDDSLMHADCAEIIMRIYEADTKAMILGIAGGDGPSPLSLDDVAQKEGSAASGRARAIAGSHIGMFLWKHLFLMNRAATFVSYEGPFGSPVPDWAAAQGLDLRPTIQLPGCRMTVRRSALLREPFESAFRSYCPGEDFDISYRLSRIGMICTAPAARIYHHEVAASRIRREQELVLSICNAAYLLRKHSPDLDRDRRRWALLMSRRLLAELLKDGLSRRWGFPQLRAARRAMAISRKIMTFPDKAQLAGWYIAVQQDILKQR